MRYIDASHALSAAQRSIERAQDEAYRQRHPEPEPEPAQPDVLVISVPAAMAERAQEKLRAPRKPRPTREARPPVAPREPRKARPLNEVSAHGINDVLGRLVRF